MKTAEITFKMDENCWEYIKNIPTIHRDTFIHLAILDAINSDLYKKLCGISVVEEEKEEKVENTSTTSTPASTSTTSNPTWDNF